MKTPGKIKKVFAVYCVLVLMFALMTLTAYATNDPIQVVNTCPTSFSG